MAEKPATHRDALRTLRTAWQVIRRRQANAKWAKTAGVPPILDEDLDADGQSETGRA
jgi:hypothetical protein